MQEITALAINGSQRYDLTLTAGTVRTGRLPPGVYKVTSSIASFVGVKNSGDAAASTTVANGMQMAIGETNYLDVPFASPGYEIQAAAAGAGAMQITGPL